MLKVFHCIHRRKLPPKRRHSDYKFLTRAGDCSCIISLILEKMNFGSSIVCG
jgi:hypothetical protein